MTRPAGLRCPTPKPRGPDLTADSAVAPPAVDADRTAGAARCRDAAAAAATAVAAAAAASRHRAAPAVRSASTAGGATALSAVRSGPLGLGVGHRNPAGRVMECARRDAVIPAPPPPPPAGAFAMRAARPQAARSPAGGLTRHWTHPPGDRRHDVHVGGGAMAVAALGVSMRYDASAGASSGAAHQRHRAPPDEVEEWGDENIAGIAAHATRGRMAKTTVTSGAAAAGWWPGHIGR